MKQLLIFFIMMAFCGCVSVNLPSDKGEKAKNVQFTPPEAPFSDIASASSDRAWISEKSGNTISFLSECRNPVDLPLAQLEAEGLAVLSNLKIVSTQDGEFNGRQSLESTAQGEVDGVLVKMSLVTFKKNGCNYSLSYGGVATRFEEETLYFRNFLKGFKAP